MRKKRKKKPPTDRGFRDLPDNEKPRERLFALGVAALSDTELVAVLLRSGLPGITVMALAHELLRKHDGLAGLLVATPQALRHPGVGPAKAANLFAAVEIGRRLARERLPETPLTRPAEVARYLTLRYLERDQEVMGALFLDRRHRLIGERALFRGTLDRAAVEPRAVLRESLTRGAAGVVLFHTHPSGDPTPSDEDLQFTRRMAIAGDAVGVTLVDHLVVGSCGRWVSLRERVAW